MGPCTLQFDARLYPLGAFYRACYTFLDRVYVRLDGDPNGMVTIQLKAKPGVSAAAFAAVQDELGNELIHHALREKVASSNQKIREYIVMRALASAEGAKAPEGAPAAPPEPVLDEELEKEIEKLLAEVEKEGGEDPLKIAVPWEEKAEAGNGNSGGKDASKS